MRLQLPDIMRLPAALAAAVLFATLATPAAPRASAAAQHAVATGGVNVRQARTSASTALAHLAHGDTVALIEQHALQGYFHVETDAGVKGWAWAARLEVIDSAPVSPPAPV